MVTAVQISTSVLYPELVESRVGISGTSLCDVLLKATWWCSGAMGMNISLCRNPDLSLIC